jgi:hypothetical protein
MIASWFEGRFDSISIGKTPTNIAILWDNSGSRSTAQELELIEKFIASCGDSLTIDLYAFNSAVEPKKSFKKSTANELLATLKAMVYDGATRFDILKAVVNTNQYEHFLLFSDGMTSLGE